MNTHGIEYSARRIRFGKVARGFTLVEVMVALIIIAIGMLGIAKMQALALSSNGASRTRALAAIEASSLAAAMHANRLYWSSPAAVATAGVINVVTLGGVATPTSTGTLQAALDTAAGNTCATGTSMPAGSYLSCYCTTANAAPCAGTYISMAANDIYDWSVSLGNLLPSATATVSCPPPSAAFPVSCTIKLQWVENAVNLTTQESAAAAGATPAFQNVSYTLSVVP